MLRSIKNETPNTKSREKRDIENQGKAIQLKEKDCIVHDMNTLDESNKLGQKSGQKRYF